MGKKYIIEMNMNTPILVDGDTAFYQCVNAPGLMISEDAINKLTPYEEPHKQEQFDFSERLSEAVGRFWNGSNREFAEICGTTEATMSRYLSGARMPKGPIITAMAKALHVSTDYLLGLED